MNINEILFNLPLRVRKAILLFLDSILFLFAYYFLTVVNNNIYLSFSKSNIVILLSLGLLIYLISGQYKAVLRFYTSREFYFIVLRNLILSILYFSIIQSNLNLSLFTNILLFWIFLTTLISFSRVVLRDILFSYKKNLQLNHLNVAIYGAGEAGVQLFRFLSSNSKYKVVTFLDNDSQFWGRSIEGVQINSPKILNKYSQKLDLIFLALPSANSKNIKEILDELQKFPVTVLKIPSLNEIIEDNSKISDFRPIGIEDLLGRKKIVKNKAFLEKNINGSTICITGAGGSIGKEICRQVIEFKPKILVLIEFNEPSLYEINQELLALDLRFNQSTNLIPVLGSACDFKLVLKVFKENNVDYVFHAAAYKHVPLVELNPISGVLNNILATRTICEASKIAGVKKVVLISSDKAVRPTNIMGASKRISELIIQAYSEISIEEKNKFETTNTCFTMVRFGNVLWSSGSVAPLFIEQIKSGGPVTLTHNDITRYFMSIDEASNLVLQATFLSEGGEVFLLDMGTPLPIRKLAEQMIRLSGKTIKNKSNPNGDIELVITGLRPGEKLYEELLIDSNSVSTSNKLIYKAVESHIPAKKLFPMLDLLQENLMNYELKNSVNLILELVPKWKTKL